MSHTVSPAMAAHLAGDTHSRCTLLRLDLRDGTRIGITNHDQDLEFDLGDGLVSYSAGTGVLPSNVVLATGLDADNFEVEGPISDLITREAVLGGRFDRAGARLFQINWQQPSAGAIRLMRGNVTGARVAGGKFVLEIRNQFDRYNQVVGNLITNRCKADFGDPATGCHGTPISMTATITEAASELMFAVSFDGDFPTRFFDLGTVEALTGQLAGTLPVEIFRWYQTAPGSAEIELFVPMVEAPAIGDTLMVEQGCPRIRSACMERGQILNFRAYPEVPGSDQVLKPTIPGQGNDD